MKPGDLTPTELETPLSNRLLAALSPEDFAAIEPLLRPLAMRLGAVLFEAGEEVEAIHFPCRGAAVSLRVVTRDGEEVEAASIGREGAVGGVVSGGNQPAFGRAVVQAPGAAFRIDADDLEALKRSSYRVRDLFERYADVLLAQVMQSAACNALHSVDERCCRWLLASQDRADAPAFPITQQNLAAMLGVQRTTVTAVMGRLQARGYIVVRRGRVEVCDRPGLERAACECYGAVERHFGRLLPQTSPAPWR